MAMTRGSARDLTGRVVGISVTICFGIAGYLLFTWLSGQQTDPGMYAAYHGLALNIALVAAALAAGRVPNLFLAKSDAERVSPVVLAASYVLAGVGLWRGLGAFSERVSAMSGIGLVCLTGAVALAVSHLAVYAQRHEFGGAFSRIFNWLVETRSLVVIIGMLAGVYAFIIRPLFVGKSTYSVLAEWTVVVAVGIVILGISRFRIGRSLVEEESPMPERHRHRQQIGVRTDSDYVQLKSLERRFVEESDQTMLVHFLVSLLTGNGVNESDIAVTLKRLIDYRGQRERGKDRHRAEAERAQLLNTTVSGLQTVAQPSRYSMYTRYAVQTPDALAAIQESKTVSGLADDFCKEGDCSGLLVRLSLLLAAAGTRTEDIYEVLRPLLTHRQNSQSERERLWRDVVGRIDRYAPRTSLKE